MADPLDVHNDKFVELVNQINTLDGEGATTAIKNLETFSKSRPPAPEPEPETPYVPVTRLEKARHSVACALDNETTRTLIKAGGSFAAVGLVVWSTVHRDHVIDRQAIAQANQRNS